MRTGPWLPATGGGGMAGVDVWEVILASLLYAAILAAGLIVAGIVLLWLYRRLNLGLGRDIDRLNSRLDRLESRIGLYLQTTGGFQEWARLKEREEEFYEED